MEFDRAAGIATVRIGEMLDENLRTEIENLYLTGANTSRHGVAGTMLTGKQTASAILGKDLRE